MPAAPTPSKPAAPREPRAPHNMTLLTTRPAALPPDPTGGYSLGRARETRRRRFLQPQATSPSCPDSGPRTNPPNLPQGTASNRGPHAPRPSLAAPEAPHWPTTAPLNRQLPRPGTNQALRPHPVLSPAVTHRDQLHCRALPPNSTPNPAQKKLREPGGMDTSAHANGHPQRPTPPSPCVQPSKPPKPR